MRGSSQWDRSSQCGIQIQEEKRCPTARGFTARATPLAPIDRIGYMVCRLDPFIGGMICGDRIAAEVKGEVRVAPAAHGPGWSWLRGLQGVDLQIHFVFIPYAFRLPDYRSQTSWA